MKIGTVLFLAGLGAAQAILQSSETCVDVWAHDDEDNMATCAEKIGADYWGWTNGRYGIGQCEPCDCPECPPVEAPTKAPTPTPVPLPQKCIGISGSFSGDPHMFTFDGLQYDCQGAGEFQLLKTLESDFGIQARFVPFKTGKRPTVGRSVVWNTDDGDPVIQVTIPDAPAADKFCSPYVDVYGQRVMDLPAKEFIAPGIQVKHEKYGTTGKKEQVVIYHHQSGFQATITGKRVHNDKCSMVVQVCIPDAWDRSKETFLGLLGNADGNPGNDWMDRDNNPVPVPESKIDRLFDDAYNFCIDWCIRDAAHSLFVYEGDTSHATYEDCDKPPDTETQACVENPSEEILKVCGRRAYGCLVDACTNADWETGESQLESEASMKEKGCGTELQKFDFSEPNADVWGEILLLEQVNPFLAFRKDANTAAERIFEVPAAAHMIEIEFKFLESGAFNKKGDGQDYVYITVGGTQLDLLGFTRKDTNGNPEEYFYGAKDGILWNRRAISHTNQNFGLNTTGLSGDQMHKVLVQIPKTYFEDGKLHFKFEALINDAEKELAGVDDLRIIAYGLSCGGEQAIQYNSGCSVQIFYEDFQDKDVYEWGTIEKMQQNVYVRLDGWSRMMEVTRDDIPEKADTVSVEFDVYKLGNWSVCDDGTSCSNNDLQVIIGGNKIVDLELFEKGSLVTTSGKSQKIHWTQSHETSATMHIDLLVPSDYFHNKDLEVELYLTLGSSPDRATPDTNVDIAVGIDEVRVTTFAQGCDNVPERRRNLQEFMASPHFVPRKYKSRNLFVLVETDECKCKCPTLPGETDTSATKAVMGLYHSRDTTTCKPSGDRLGTMTMSPKVDGTIEFVYNVNDEFEVKEANLHVGKERLPYDVSGFLPPDEYPYTVSASGTSATIIVDPIVCDIYVAAHARVCGDFPTLSPTSSPTTAPTIPPPPTGGGSYGDPHVLTWGGAMFDFHGACDLVLLDNPNFHNGLGMTIHIRTKIVTWWSYIETAVVRIGNETIEVTGGEEHKYFVNGVRGENGGKDFLWSTLGLKVHLKQATSKQLKVRIDLLNADAIGLEVFKDFVKVNVKMMDMKWKKFEGSVGLMGSYPHGETVGRDGMTQYTDMNEFGQEWQVRQDEPKLFSAVEGPQYPNKCVMPTEVNTEDKRRRLGESMISTTDAEIACSRVDEKNRDACIFDVLATNDLEMAGSY